MVFARRVTKATKEPFRERIFTTGTEVRLDFSYKHARVKQYLKEGRALRIETVINKPATWDFAPGSSTCPSSSNKPGRSMLVCL